MKRLILMMLILSPVASFAQQTNEQVLRLTLEDCLELAYSGNYNRQSIALSHTAKEDILNQSKMSRLPNLTASVSENYSHTNGNSSNWNGNYSIGTSVTIYNGGQITKTIEKNRLSTEQAYYRTLQNDNELTVQILQAFLTTLGYEELLVYQKAVYQTSEEQVKQGEARLAAGEIIESDYLLLEAQFVSDYNSYLETSINRDNSLIALKNLMALDLDITIEIIYPQEELLTVNDLPTEESFLSLAMETLPELFISDYDVEIAIAGVSIAKTAYSPTLNLSASIGSGHSANFSNYGNQLTDRFNEQVGLSLNIPIFNRNSTKSNVRQSQIALQQAELDRLQTEATVKQNMLQHYRSVIVAESQYRSSDTKKNAYNSSFNSYRLKFEEGAITTVELLQQQNNYINAMNNYIQDKYGFLFKRKVLDVYMGAM